MDAEAVAARLRDRLGPALEARLAALEEETGGLLARDALLLMVADEEGLLPAQATLDVGAEPAAAAEVVGVVERLTPTRPFRRGDGSTGFVSDLDLRTDAGVLRVVLWDDAVRAAQGTVGQRVRLTGLAERPRGAARELHATRATRVERA